MEGRIRSQYTVSPVGGAVPNPISLTLVRNAPADAWNAVGSE
jgi:hypothetical protein